MQEAADNIHIAPVKTLFFWAEKYLYFSYLIMKTYVATTH